MSGRRITAASACGGFIGAVENGGGLLEIVEVATAKTYRTYDLKKVIREHFLEHGVEARIDGREMHVSQISWESVAENAQATKIGLLLDSFAILMIIDIRDVKSQAIIIRQDSKEGIERFDWIPPVIIADEHNYGGYVNSRQIVIFTKGGLQMRLFSLDCTEMLLSVCKPAKNHILLRPEHDNRIWSIVAYSLDFSSSPIVYHFFNNGSTSSILYYFKLPVAIQSDFQLSWSNSGKWLLYFDDSYSLFGFNFKAFNSLGLYKRKSERQEEIPTGDPLMDIYYRTEGMDFDEGNTDPIESGSSAYCFQWLSHDSKDYSFITSAGGGNSMEFLVYSVTDCRLVDKTEVKLHDIDLVWRDSYEENVLKFRKVSNKNIINKSFVSSRILVSDEIVCVVGESHIMLFKIEFRPEIHIAQLGMFDLSCKLSFTEFVEANPNYLLIGTERGVILYSINEQIISKVYPVPSLYNGSVYLCGTSLAIYKLNVRTARLYWEFHDIAKLLTFPESSNHRTMGNLHYKDDNSKTISLLKDVQHSEPSRLKRNRFDHRRLSVFNPNSEEITDTFSLQKRQRK